MRKRRSLSAHEKRGEELLRDLVRILAEQAVDEELARLATERDAASSRSGPELGWDGEQPKVRRSLRVRTAAEILDVDESTVRKMLNRGDLEGHRIGTRGVRVYAESITAYQGARRLGRSSQEQAPAAQPQRQSLEHRKAVARLRGLGILD